MNDQHPPAVQPEELALWEPRAIRDAIAGLTGNLGVEVCAQILDAQGEVQRAEFAAFTDTPESSELVAVGAA